MALVLIEKKVEDGKTQLHYQKGGVDIYRCYSKVLTNQEQNAIEKDIKDNFVKVKKEKLVNTYFGEIKKSKKQEFLDYAQIQIERIESKRNQLNV